jgi:hypothetical protein
VVKGIAFHLPHKLMTKKRGVIIMKIAKALFITVVLIVTSFPIKTLAVYDKIFSSEHIDDSGLKTAVKCGQVQSLNQTFYDKANDITVHFDSVLTDDKETKLLFTYQSKKKNLKNYYVDIFEGVSSVNLIIGGSKKIPLDNMGWGSRYYNSKENKVAEAESFESIKKYEGKEIRLEIENLTIYENGRTRSLKAIWPLSFKLDKSAISERETVKINKEFDFENERYKIKEVEFSSLETRVVVTGTDTKFFTDENGKQYKVMSKLEKKLLAARKVDKEHGYTVDEKKSGVFLKSDGEKVEPIFSKGEVEGEDDEYLMIFAPVKNRQDCLLEVGDDIKISLTK